MKICIFKAPHTEETTSTGEIVFLLLSQKPKLTQHLLFFFFIYNKDFKSSHSQKRNSAPPEH